MKETDLTKLARWIVPGWIAILSFYTFVMVDMSFPSPNNVILIPSIPDFLSKYEGITSVLITVLIGAAGVPLGFTIYQAYFYLRWNSPFSRDGLIPPMITGRMQDLEETIKGLDVNQLSNSVEWREEWVFNALFLRDHGFRWRYIENFFTEIAQKIDFRHNGAVSVYSRHRYLHEVTHTLGASVGSVYIGFMGYFFLKFIKEQIWLSAYIFGTFILVGSLFYFLNKEDNQSLDNDTDPENMDMALKENPIAIFNWHIRFLFIKKPLLISICQPSSLFMTSLLFVHFLDNPVFNPPLDPSFNPFLGIHDWLIRSILIFFIIVLWVNSKKRSSLSFKIGDGISLILGLVVAIVFRQLPSTYKDWVDWAYFSSITLFMISNLILFKNRQNAKNDMLALENYSIKRYLFEEQVTLRAKPD